MKKLFIVLAVASVGFVACNNDSDKKTEGGDTTKVETPTVTPPADTNTVVPPVDTTKVDTSVKK